MKVIPVLNEFGNVVKNQYQFLHEGCEYFQSYETVVAKVDHNFKIFLDEKYWDASKTTAKYRNMFLNKSTTEIKTMIHSGQIELVNLNSE